MVSWTVAGVAAKKVAIDGSDGMNRSIVIGPSPVR